MNALAAAFGEWWQTLGVPASGMLLLKATALLAVGWVLQFVLARANPRWRVILWRGVAVGLIALPVLGWLVPAIEVRVEVPAPSTEEPAVGIESVVPSRGVQPARLPPIDLAAEPGADSAPYDKGDTAVWPKRHQESSAETRPLPPAFDAVSSAAAPRVSTAVLLRRGLAAVWLGGIALLTLRFGIGYRRVHRMVRNGKEPPEWLKSECSRIARTLKCPRGMEIIQSGEVQSPLICGMWRARLLLPARMCEDSYRGDLPGILAHELAHVQSRDLPWNAALHLVSIVLWFHPLAWPVRKAHLAACERVCDAVSAGFLGDTGTYCRMLARVAVEAASSVPAAGIAMARTCDVSRRLKALRRKLFQWPLRRRSVVGFGLAGLLAVVLIGALQLAFVAASPTEPAAAADAAQPPQADNAASHAEQPGKAVPRQMTVRIVDEAGKPIAGAKITAQVHRRKTDYMTDAAGKAVIEVPPPGPGYLVLNARAAGRVPAVVGLSNGPPGDQIPTEFTFALERGHPVGGVVHDEQGRPIEGVEIRFSASSSGPILFAGPEAPPRTDAEGKWRYDLAPRKREATAIRLEHPDYVSDIRSPALSETEEKQLEDRTFVMVMRRGIVVEGTVTDPQGKPLAGAVVAQSRPPFSGTPYATTRTDERGHYRSANVAAEKTVLTVAASGLAPDLRFLDVRSAMEHVDFRLEKARTLQVRVVDKEGKPVADALISLEAWRGYGTLIGLRNLGIPRQTDETGRWTWASAPKDQVELSIRKEGYMSINRLPLATRDAEHVVTLPPPLRISGRVLDAETKQPIEAFRVIKGYTVGGGDPSVGWDRSAAIEGKGGQYTLAISTPYAGCAVRIEAAGHLPALSRSFKSDEGDVNFDALLAKGKSLSVLVRLPDGKPATGAASRVTEPKGHVWVSEGRFREFEVDLRAGADGRITIEPQDDAFRLIVFHDQGYGWATSEELAAKPEVTLKPWARIEGVVRRGTKPWPGLTITLMSNDAFNVRPPFTDARNQSVTDAEGRFAFERCTAGKWHLACAPLGVLGDQRLELAPGQTLKLTLGGIGRPVVGRLRWPEGATQDMDVSRIRADASPKWPEWPVPKEIREKGADAYRAWAIKWQDSDEGKAWQEKYRNLADNRRNVSVSGDGSFRVECVVAGSYTLGVGVTGNTAPVPEQPKTVWYHYEFFVPEIPGGVSDEPLDLGIVALKHQTRPEPAAGPPVKQAAGERSEGGLREHVELLRKVVANYSENKEKIRTWQGRAKVETRMEEGVTPGYKQSQSVQFVFDASRKSLRCNTTWEKWTDTSGGRETARPVPQICNCLRTPEGSYVFPDRPARPSDRPLTLAIYPADKGRYVHFDPFDLSTSSHADVATLLAGYIANFLDHPGMAGVKVKHDRELVVIELGSAKTSLRRFTINLAQGGNCVSYEWSAPQTVADYRWTYEHRDGIWLPKTFSENTRGREKFDRTVTFVESVVNQKLAEDAFSLANLGLQPGDEVDDRRTGQRYKYTEEK